MRNKRFILKALPLLLIALLLTGCRDEGNVLLEPVDVSAASTSEQGTEETETSTGDTEEISTEESSEPVTEESGEVVESTVIPEEPEEKKIQLMMVGDNLLHMGIINTGKQADGTYNYDFLFNGIQDFLAEAEIKMINQETIFGGNQLGFSGYPMFNSPTEVGDAIVKAGFNVVLHSSNHAADKGIDGLLHNVNYWKQYPEMTVLGIHEKDESAIKVINIEGIDFAILNYTYSTNTEILPEAVRGNVDMLCKYDETGRLSFTELNPQVLTDIAAAKEMADVVVVCPHWGREYTTVPSVYQENFAKQMTEAGADIIIGTHPHVIQPMEWITADNGNQALCYYSLGNYVSTQKQALCMLEAMAWITFTIVEDEITIDVENTGVLPLVCHYTANPVRLKDVYLLEDYTEEQAAAHGIWIYGEVPLYLQDLQTWSNDVFGDNVLSAAQVLGLEEPAEEEPDIETTQGGE